ncbi:MAG: hypothetical protein ACLUI3_07360 [Christensenellales bacterium]
MKEERRRAAATDGCTGRWLCDTAEEAARQGRAGTNADMTLERRRAIAAMRKAGIDNAEHSSRGSPMKKPIRTRGRQGAEEPVAAVHPRHRGSGDPMRDGDKGMMPSSRRPSA